MVVEQAPTFEPQATREGIFSHDTPYHRLEEAVFNDWMARDLPVERATVEQDERPSFRSDRGLDIKFQNINVDLTASAEKVRKNAQSPGGSPILKHGEKVVAHIPISDREFRGKTIDEIIQDPNLMKIASERTFHNFLCSMPPREAAQLMARLQARAQQRQ